MATITHATASAHILTACDTGTLVQGKWHGRDRNGREIACLLGAIDPSVTSAADCNGDLMPMWLAELTPTLFDGLPAESIIPTARRYGELVGRWHALSVAQWDAILTRVLIRCIDDAVSYARPVSEGKPYWPAVESACTQVRAALNGDGDIKAAAESAAESAARAAAESAPWATWAATAAESAARAAAESAPWATWAATAAESAARAAAESAAWAAAAAAPWATWAATAAESAARAAAESAAWATWAATAAGAAVGAAARAAASAASAAWATWAAAAYENLFNFVLDQIAVELGAA